VSTGEVAESTLNAADQALAAASVQAEALDWTVLLDEKDQSRWRAGGFGEDPEFEVGARGIVLPIGVPMAGLTYTDTPPKTPYSLEISATKEYGSDFFLGITFPVAGTHITLVLGGWGGVVCGLSCLDGEDASTNDTKTLRNFPNGKLTVVVIDVSDDRIRARVDGEVIMDVALEGREITLRPEVAPSVPLGIASFATCTTLHQVRLGMPRAPAGHLDGSGGPR
jgi:hypothetical protein